MKQKRLISAFLMLLVTVVALTTASYAWFSVNNAVTLEGLDVNVNAAEGIQVSTDAANWKASIGLADIATGYVGHTNQVPTILAPVSTIGSQTVGNFEMFYGSLIEGGTTTLDTSALTEVAGSSGSYIAFDLFIKASTVTPIYLDSVSTVAYSGATGSSVGLEYSSRVAFFNQGTDATSTPATATALAAGTAASQVIWEPHALSHTAVALGQGASIVAKTPYYGVKAAGTGIGVTQTDFTTDTVHYGGPVATITPDTDAAPFDLIPSNVIFTAGVGITKVRIYVWFEGQDIDCENSASLGLLDDATSKLIVTIKFKKL